MLISTVKLKGFRNFENATINMESKTLIIGANDVGKSNLLYAMRILLDKSLSEADIEPSDSDFYAFNNSNKIEIILNFKNVFEDCVISSFKGKISDNGRMCLAYKATRDPMTGEKNYYFEAGRSENALEEIKGRYYLRKLNMKYLASNRDLISFIRKERKNLLVDIKKNRSKDETQYDENHLKKIDKTLDLINKRVRKLKYINKATEDINTELHKLSIHHQTQNIEFDVGAWDSSQFVDNLHLVSKIEDRNLAISGDGRSNQLFIALWAQRNEVKEEKLLEVSFYCIEEPEAHLHPHQQRKLASYLSEQINSQVFITSHSPQIAAEFPPQSIVRLHNHDLKTIAANNGCNQGILDAIQRFGHRMSVIPAEALFSNVVLLVEGQSELLFYKALAKDIGIDLDRYNISILMVDGVGFDYYVEVLTTLGIEFVIRTDNDFFKLPNKNSYQFAGIKRGIKIYRTFFEKEDDMETLLEDEDFLMNVPKEVPGEIVKYTQRVITLLEGFYVFLAKKDLENDLHESPLSEQIESYFKEYFSAKNDPDLVAEMQKRKATFMFDFVNDPNINLSELKDHSLAAPLKKCVKLVENLYGTY